MSFLGLKRDRHTLVSAALAGATLIGIHVALTSFLGPRPHARAAASDALFVLGLCVAGSLAVLAALSVRGRTRGATVAWSLIASAMFLRAAAAALSFFVDPYRTPPLAPEIVTGGLYLAAYSPLLLGLLLMPLRRLTRIERASLGLDAAMIAVATGLFLVASLGFPIAAWYSGDAEKLALVIAMLTLNVALIGVVAELLLIQAYAAESLSIYLLLASCAADIAADIAFVVRFTRGQYSAGELVDTGWLAATVLVGIAARIEGATAARGERPRRQVVGVRRVLTPMLFQYLPMVFVVGLGAVIIRDHYLPFDIPTDVLLWGMAAVGLMVLARLVLSGVSNQRLLRSVGASEERYRLIAENASDVIWVRDLSLGLTYISPSVSRLRGLPPEAAVRSGLEEILTPASAQEARATLGRMLARAEREGPDAVRSESITLESELRRYDGSTVWVETALRFLADGQGRPRAILGVTRDIGRRKRAEEDLLAANAELQSRVARRTEDLHSALEKVRQLQGLLPICAACKKIRDEDGQWEPIDEYTARHGDFLFSHGLCPDCLKHYSGT